VLFLGLDVQMLFTNLCQHFKHDVSYESTFPMEMSLSCGTLSLLPQSHVPWRACSNPTEPERRIERFVYKDCFLGKINVRVEGVGSKKVYLCFLL